MSRNDHMRMQWARTEDMLADLSGDPTDTMVEPIDLDDTDPNLYDIAAVPESADARDDPQPASTDPDDMWPGDPDAQIAVVEPDEPEYRTAGDDLPIGMLDPTTGAAVVEDTPPADLPGTTTKRDKPDAPPRFNKALAAGFVGAVGVVVVGVTGALIAMRGGPTVAPVNQSASAPTAVSVVTAAPSAPGKADNPDNPIPFTASAHCPPGSTAAQSVAGTDPTRAWVCILDGAIGQVLNIDLGRSMCVTAIDITPGWVGTDASGVDQWLQHRVVSLVQWILTDNNGPPTVVQQDTHNAHGPATQPMPHGCVLASHITMIVLKTSRAPADAPTTASSAPGDPAAPGDAGILGSVLGTSTAPPPAGGGDPLTGQPGSDDPADNSFAVSAITVYGHNPINH